MADLTHPKLIYAKGCLFLLGGLLSGTILVLESPKLKTLALVVLLAWCFARFYYFAFYVIGHYVDPGYRFSGLWSFGRYLLKRSNPLNSGITKSETNDDGGNDKAGEMGSH